ncbi:GOLPH3/VPS74 family protein [Pseudarthrobacter chlorophenolicus]|uniref:GOLPH3/VPS74 family protein n=1 Tax=Pseudarthrobacter chlorophenolicus TaxID=85085 RepID=UPI0005F2B528|nr:GPP34 family phosphoprotein [Pseudarthrobacter chlorophenolicus]
MNAEAPAAVNLNLPQQFLLLATNDKDGKPEVPLFALRTTVAGAILAELDLVGAIELQGKHIRATGSAARDDLAPELELIRGKSRPHTPARWVSIMEGRAQVHRIYEGMAALGVVEHVGERHLARFRPVRYPERDHEAEAAILNRIESTLSGATPTTVVPEPAADGAAEEPATQSDKAQSDTAQAGAQKTRTLALIALLEAAGLLHKLFPDADRNWASGLAKDYWPARAVEDELRLIRLAEEETAML